MSLAIGSGRREQTIGEILSEEKWKHDFLGHRIVDQIDETEKIVELIQEVERKKLERCCNNPVEPEIEFDKSYKIDQTVKQMAEVLRRIQMCITMFPEKEARASPPALKQGPIARRGRVNPSARSRSGRPSCPARSAGVA